MTGAPNLERLLRRCDTVVPPDELATRVAEGRPLRVKLGLDPTAPAVTLGWAVVLRKLRDFQEQGHTAVLIVGDFTARVGDPSLKSETRNRLSAEQVDAFAQQVLTQFEKILLPEPLEDGGLDASRIRGHVRFESVGFAYDDSRRVVDSVSFEAAPGEMVAFVGLTGAGKTTIASLIPRFFEPTSGRVLVDGVDVSRYSLSSLRERVALVPQQPVLFSGTIADNIRYGRLDASDAEVVAAARAAHVHDFVATLPDGYDTQVLERGATLSGGERQRIGIARALLKASPILILDEPTSAVDALSEGAIFDSLRRLRANHTIVVIAHRLSTIRDATRILVLHGGRVVARGTHEELTLASPLYRRMCQRLSVGAPLNDDAEADQLDWAVAR